MRKVGIIQARMGSSRLPGKMMLPLDCTPVITHVIRRVKNVECLDEVVVTTSRETSDDILERYATKAGVDVYRGDESDVLGRVYEAATRANAESIVRITGDCPLIDPEIIRSVVHRLESTNVDYATNSQLERTFPHGLDVEAFTYSSFDRVHEQATAQYEREHVTPFYYQNPDVFAIGSIGSDDVFDESALQERTDLRLTLDEADDYELLKRVYENVSYEGTLPLRDAIAYIDENELHELNDHVRQKTLDDG